MRPRNEELFENREHGTGDEEHTNGSPLFPVPRSQKAPCPHKATCPASLSIVGLDKNTGKTETLNYVLKQMIGKSVGLTSIGIDGESTDLVTNTSKPEITIYKGMIFTTSEKHYNQRRLVSEVLQVSNRQTSLGRLITARAITDGRVLLSGPPTTEWLKNIIAEQKALGVETTIVDGALSRKSIASPAITESMILATGAAVSANITQLVKRTKFICELINMPLSKQRERLINLEHGIWSIGDNDEIHDLGIKSVFVMDENKSEILKHGSRIYVAGVVNDKLLEFLKSQQDIRETTLIVRDFTKMFVSPTVCHSFIKRGGQIEVIDKTNLLAITVNPYSPTGYTLNSESIIEALKKEIDVKMIFDVRKETKQNI